MLRMDITKKIEEVNKKGAQTAHLTEELTYAHKKISDLINKDNEVASLENDIESYLNFFTQIDKHLRTLVKFIRDFISKCDNPKLIEQNQKQIKAIEGLLEEVKLTVMKRGYHPSADGANKLLESFFQVSNESLREVSTLVVTEAESSIIRPKA